MNNSFSQICGENVKVSDTGTEASWERVYTGGLAFTEHPLQEKRKYSLKFEGTCHANFGILPKDPDTLPSVRASTLRKGILENFSEESEYIKIHKSSITIEVEIRDNCMMTTSDGGHVTYKTILTKQNKYWLFVDLLLGSGMATLTSGNKCHTFHEITGGNIALKKNGTEVTQKITDPASICILKNPLIHGHEICLNISNDSDKPKSYRVTVGLSMIGPAELRRKVPEYFSLINMMGLPNDYTKNVHTFERVSGKKNYCEGNLKISRHENYVDIEYKGKEPDTDGSDITQKFSEQSFLENRQEADMYIILYLYRAVVSVISEYDGGYRCHGRNEKGPRVKCNTEAQYPSNQEAGAVLSPSDQEGLPVKFRLVSGKSSVTSQAVEVEYENSTTATDDSQTCLN